MAFLLRVQLPDVPGSLGAVASALGSAGADIEAIEIVEHRPDGTAIDDVLLELLPSVLPDALVSACHRLDGVRVLWISRYTARASLRMDLEAVEAMTQDPSKATVRLVELLPLTFRSDWAMAVRRRAGGGGKPVPEVVVATPTAPDLPGDVDDWFASEVPCLLAAHPSWADTVLAAAPANGLVLVFGRRGGPEILASELARFGHLSALATTIAAAAAADPATS